MKKAQHWRHFHVTSFGLVCRPQLLKLWLLHLTITKYLDLLLILKCLWDMGTQSISTTILLSLQRNEWQEAFHGKIQFHLCLKLIFSSCFLSNVPPQKLIHALYRADPILNKCQISIVLYIKDVSIEYHYICFLTP